MDLKKVLVALIHMIGGHIFKQELLKVMELACNNNQFSYISASMGNEVTGNFDRSGLHTMIHIYKSTTTMMTFGACLSLSKKKR